ncbi:hypothetical protein [Streptomyces sp. NPDC048644]|uniref:hypothetical protein n=1 Tax=Streptomyces sp. NPDC048644 TaxID=3365582 RepID=UPI0037151732
MRTVREAVYEVVAAVAPHEVPLLDGLAAIDDARLARLFADRGGRKEPLGFGFADVAGLVTPVVWSAVDEAARHAAREAVDKAAPRVDQRVLGAGTTMRFVLLLVVLPVACHLRDGARPDEAAAPRRPRPPRHRPHEAVSRGGRPPW